MSLGFMNKEFGHIKPLGKMYHITNQNALYYFAHSTSSWLVYDSSTTVIDKLGANVFGGKQSINYNLIKKPTYGYQRFKNDRF